MADVIDQAQAYEERERAAAIQRRVAAVPHSEDVIDCRECGDEIPEARRRAVPGCRTCAPCQAEMEIG